MKSDTKQLTRKDVLKQSGYISKTATEMLMFVLCASICVLCLCFDFITFIRYPLMIISEFCAIICVVAAIRSIWISIKILRGKYSIKNRKLLNIRSKRVIDADKYGKVLDFGDLRITIDEAEVANYSIGQEIDLVFAKNMKYPIAIIKRNI